MKHKSTLIMTLILSFVLITLMSSDTSAQGKRRMFVADTGLITLGPNQSAVLSISVGPINDLPVNTVIQKMTYSQDVCNDQGVCKLTLDNLQSSNFTLNAGEAIQLKTGEAKVRFRVLTRRNNLKVTLSIVDNLTGNVNSFFDIFVTIEY